MWSTALHAAFNISNTCKTAVTHSVTIASRAEMKVKKAYVQWVLLLSGKC